MSYITGNRLVLHCLNDLPDTNSQITDGLPITKPGYACLSYRLWHAKAQQVKVQTLYLVYKTTPHFSDMKCMKMYETGIYFTPHFVLLMLPPSGDKDHLLSVLNWKYRCSQLMKVNKERKILSFPNTRNSNITQNNVISK